MYFDYLYLILVMPAVIFSFWASAKVNSTFKKYSSKMSARSMTGRDAAYAVLRQNGVTNVQINRISGDLTDHYDPRTNVINLSEKVYDSTSIAAIGVACHEAGHAVQYAENYTPMKLRNSIIPATNLGSKLAVPLFMIGLILSSYAAELIFVAYLGIIAFALSTVFQLLTLPTEFNASRRAITAVENSILTEEETKGAKKVLTAAALTYVAALAVSLASLLRLIIIANSRRRD